PVSCLLYSWQIWGVHMTKNAIYTHLKVTKHCHKGTRRVQRRQAMERKVKQYGWVPDLPDARDHMYAAPQPVLAQLPPQVDLRPQCPPVIDQGALGSCTANAIANAHLFDQRKQKAPQPFLPSRLFIYYNERAMEGTVNSDSGAMIRDGIKS